MSRHVSSRLVRFRQISSGLVLQSFSAHPGKTSPPVLSFIDSLESTRSSLIAAMEMVCFSMQPTLQEIIGNERWGGGQHSFSPWSLDHGGLVYLNLSV